MHRPDRNNSAGGRQPGGGFPDPFSGFGFGFGAGHPLIDDFFTRDPFDDPFFTRPFGGIFGSGGGGLFGSGSLLGQGVPFGPRFSPFANQDHGFLEQRPFNPQPEGRRGPIIEELDEDHPDTSGTRPRSTQEPIVEHPDDEVRPAAGQSHHSRNIMRRNQSNNEPSSNFQSYSFHSSSVTYGGPDGAYYTSSTKRAAGPSGVVAEEHHEKESSGQEIHRISRGIKDKGRSVTRKRNAEGREGTVDTLHNLNEEGTGDFEKNWEAAVGRNLPGWNKNRSRALNSGPGNASRPALEGGPSLGWHGAREA
ncbi:hypothetical protein O6H91_03G084500 [Diphasiastrum complanatum]|uniref:Uncharacterized protein n=3 Tax=Diphasiastrum complanatum TaxID=34168 RepID=A0ACC2E8U1_DIPCM|nr:hypothetical protein O6H91_03G084500 [Diphasiastrum complanatum]KAJ7562792.1 hypothetical protein O6H91_03G084500 [Diphasiastrum complanatum]KAJ7562793.1 hypothetical protein O6H91_03G084500 [Diphasiastrum complanatum]